MIYEKNFIFFCISVSCGRGGFVEEEAEVLGSLKGGAEVLWEKQRLVGSPLKENHRPETVEGKAEFLGPLKGRQRWGPLRGNQS
jgi:hypothetical protein